MASDGRKKTEPAAYKDTAGWGDSVSVSKKAMEELAEQAESATEEAKAFKAAKLQEMEDRRSTLLREKEERRKAKQKKEIKEEPSQVTTQLKTLSGEIDKILTELEDSFLRVLRQLGKEISSLSLSIYHIFMRFLFHLFVKPVRGVGGFFVYLLSSINNSLDRLNKWIHSPTIVKKKQPPVRNPVEQQPKEDEFMKRMQRQFPDVFYGINFSNLAQKGITFLNIKNVPLYEGDLSGISLEDEQNILLKALKEINSCAEMAKSLPTPTKGRYVSRPMENILEKAAMGDLKAFLQYVDNHPKPFVERQLRLSEAFATWAHKGGPIK